MRLPIKCLHTEKEVPKTMHFCLISNFLAVTFIEKFNEILLFLYNHGIDM
jgi:hypothetical protein